MREQRRTELFFGAVLGIVDSSPSRRAETMPGSKHLNAPVTGPMEDVAGEDGGGEQGGGNGGGARRLYICYRSVEARVMHLLSIWKCGARLL